MQELWAVDRWTRDENALMVVDGEVRGVCYRRDGTKSRQIKAGAEATNISLTVISGGSNYQTLCWLGGAKNSGVQVGDEEPFQNGDSRLNNIGDLAYTIAPYLDLAYTFGQDATRIAKITSGTKVAVTSARNETLDYFVLGFQHERPESIFVETTGGKYGDPDPVWGDVGDLRTREYTIP